MQALTVAAALTTPPKLRPAGTRGELPTRGRPSAAALAPTYRQTKASAAATVPTSAVAAT